MPNSQALGWRCLSESHLLIWAAAIPSSSVMHPDSWCLPSNNLCSKTEKTLLKQSLRTALVKLGSHCKACFMLTVVIKERAESASVYLSPGSIAQRVAKDYKDWSWREPQGITLLHKTSIPWNISCPSTLMILCREKPKCREVNDWCGFNQCVGCRKQKVFLLAWSRLRRKAGKRTLWDFKPILGRKTEDKPLPMWTVRRRDNNLL